MPNPSRCTQEELDQRFEAYFADMRNCMRSGAYWSLLHVVVCLPDICASLQASDGESTGRRYIHWCDTFASDPLLSGAERWRLRCRVLHQGRASTGKVGRYTAYAFAKPATTGEIDHKRLEGTTLHVDVGELAKEVSKSVTAWTEWIVANPSSPEAGNVERNLPLMVQVTMHVICQPHPRFGFSIINVAKTN